MADGDGQEILTMEDAAMVVAAAQAYDLKHRPPVGNWTRVPDTQVLRLLIGAGIVAGPPSDDRAPWVPVGAATMHRHPTNDTGWLEHDHMAGGAPHAHDRNGFQVPVSYEESSPGRVIIR